MADGRHFFLSFASRDNNKLLVEFFDELCEYLAPQLGVAKEQVGYRYPRDQRPGAAWPDGLADELGSCKAFIPIYSPAFFQSPNCGKEWRVFTDRYWAQYPGEGGSLLVLPVIWSRRDQVKIPEVVREFSYKHENYGDTYATEGLFNLRKNHANFPGKFEKFVHALAAQILLAVADRPLAPAEVPDYRGVEPLFPDAPAAPPPGRPAVFNPNQVRYFCIVGSAEELRELREDVSAYGTGQFDWRPFHPAESRPVGPLVQEVAAGLTTVPVSDARELIASIEDDSTGGVVALIVDPWSLDLPRYREVLERFDALNVPHCALLATINRGNAEDDAQHEELGRRLAAKLPRRSAAGAETATFRPRVASVEAFRRSLGEAIIELQGRVMKYLSLRRPLPGDGPRRMPRAGGAVDG